MKKTRKTAIGFLTTAMLLSCGTAAVTAFAAGESASDESIGWVNEWQTTVAASDKLGGSAYITGLTSGGNCARTDRSVKLDGLTVTFRVGEQSAATAKGGLGFGFADKAEWDSHPTLNANVFNATLWTQLYANDQSRLTMQGTHDYNKTQIAYKEPELTTGFGAANSGHYVLNSNGTDLMPTISMKFMYVPSHGVWSTTITLLDENGNKDDTHKFGQETNPSTAYFAHQWVENVLDSDGKCWIFAYGYSEQDAYFKAE